MSSFDDLAEQFRTRFITNIPPTKSIHDLRVCRQEANKSLRSYLDKFNKIAMRIQNLSDETAIEALKNGTRLGRLKDDIMVKKPDTFTKAMALATRLIDMDEDRRVRQEDDRTPARVNDKIGFGRSRPPRPFLGGPTGRQSTRFRKEVDNQAYIR